MRAAVQGPQRAVAGVSGHEGGGVVEVSGQGGVVGECGPWCGRGVGWDPMLFHNSNV